MDRLLFEPGARGYEPGAGGGGAPGRVPTDVHDQLVYFDWDGSSLLSSTGASALDLSLTAQYSVGVYPGPGVYVEAGLSCPFLDAGGYSGGVFSSSGTTAGEWDAFTISAWVWRTRASSYPYQQPIAGKWSSTYLYGSPMSYGLLVNPDGTGTGYITLSDHSTIGGDSVELPLHSWHHMGLSFDGTTSRFYADGSLLATASGGGTGISFAGHGPITLLGLPTYSAIPGTPAATVTDVRFADVARGLDWFKSVWASRRAS